MAKRWNVVSKKDGKLFTCDYDCACKSFKKINNQFLVCACCGTRYKLTNDMLRDIDIIPNRLGRFPYND